MKTSIVVAGAFVAALLASLAWLVLGSDAHPVATQEGEPAPAAATADSPLRANSAAAAAAARPDRAPSARPKALPALDCAAPQGAVATVANQTVAAAEFCAELTERAGLLRPDSPEPVRAQARILLDQHVDALLVDAALAAAQAVVTPAELDAELARIQPPAAEPTTPPAGADPSRLREQLRRRLAMRKLVDLRSDLSVAPGAAEAEYQAHPERYQSGGQAKIQLYLYRLAPSATPAEQAAAQAAAQAFAAAVRSQDPQAAAKANKLSALAPFDLEPGGTEPELQQAVAALAPSAWTAPVPVRGGWAVAQLISRAAALPKRFDEVRDEIARTLVGQRRQAEQQRIVAELRRAAVIEVLVQF